MLPDNFANLSQAQKDQYFSTGKVGAVAGTNTMGASVLTPTINSTTLNQQPAVVIPPKPAPQNLAPQVAGGNATIQANSQSLSTPATPTPTAPAPQPEAPTVTDSFVNSLKTKLGLVPQAAPAPVKQTADIAPVSAAAQGQQVAQDALNLAQNKVAGINAEIQALDAQSKADAVSLEGQGRGIDATILSRQASEISRQAAIKAIPLQVKALAAQGEVLAAQAQVASAQGKTQMAQFLYDNAQKQLDNAYTAQVANWQQNQDYQTKVYDAVSGFLDKQQQAILEEKKAQKTQISTFNKDLFDKAYASAVANKDISAQSKLIAAMKDPNDPNVANTLSAINAGIKPQASTTGGTTGVYKTDLEALAGNTLNLIQSQNGKVAFNQSIARARNDADKINAIATVALRNAPGPVREDFVNQTVGIKELDKAIAEIDKGTKTGLVNNATQYVFNLAGKDFDPKLAAIQSYIISAIQPYRNSVTGAAWGTQEEQEYQQLFGSTKYSPTELKDRLTRLQGILKDKSVNALNAQVNPIGDYNAFASNNSGLTMPVGSAQVNLSSLRSKYNY